MQALVRFQDLCQLSLLSSDRCWSGWRACIHSSGPASTREPAATNLQSVFFLDPTLINGKRVDFHMFDLAGSIGADVMLVDPTAPSCVERGSDEASFFSEWEDAKRNKQLLKVS